MQELDVSCKKRKIGETEINPGRASTFGPCLDKFVVPQLPGPVTQVLCTTNRKMRRKLETSPNDENLRSAVLLRVPCTQCRAGVSAWPANEISFFRKIMRANARAATSRSELCLPLEPRVNCSWHNTQNDSLLYEVNSVLCQKTATTFVRQSKSEEACDIGRRFAPLWKVLNAGVTQISWTMMTLSRPTTHVLKL